MKYRNVKTIVDGITFHSKKEARRYNELKLLEKGKIIEGLLLQPEFLLLVNDQKISKYIGDFKYTENGKLVIEDVKGVKTAVYRLKKRLMKAIHNIEILET